MITTIIFDMFGVICSEIASVWLQKYGSDENLETLKEKYFVPVDKGEMLEEELFIALAKLAHTTPEIVKEEFDQLTILNEKTIEIIKELKSNYKIGLCSNSPSKFIRDILTKNKLENLFDVLVISSEYGVAKPDQRLYEITLDKLQSKAEESIFIDDNSKNIASAKEAGMKAILFVNTVKLKESLFPFVNFPDSS